LLLFAVPVDEFGVSGDVGEDNEPALFVGLRKALLLIRFTAVTALIAAYDGNK
jgi:hypothetical protein